MKRGLELAAAALLLCAALVPRLRDAAAPLDRGLDGQRGGAATIAAINYERLGVARTRGYPVLDIELGERGAPDGLWNRPELWSSDVRHSPAAALLAWAALNAMAPDNWNAAWREARAPEGFELALRFPFLVLHALLLAGLWWCVREGHGPRTGLLALSLAAGSAPLLVHAGLVGPENPALAGVLWGTGFLARYVRTGRRADLALCAAAFLVGGAFGVAPLCFAVAWCALALLRTERARTLGAGLVALGAAGLSFLVHVLTARSASQRLGSDGAAALLSGNWNLPEASLTSWFSLVALLAASAGLVLALASLARARGTFALRGMLRCETAAALLLGGLCCAVVGTDRLPDAAAALPIVLAPGICALGAQALDALAPLLSRLRAGLAPLVVLGSSIALADLTRALELRFALRAPLGVTHPFLPAATLDLPPDAGRCLAGLLAPGALGLVDPRAGLHQAATLYAWRDLAALAPPHDPALSTWSERGRAADSVRRILLPDERAATSSESGCSGWRALPLN